MLDSTESVLSCLDVNKSCLPWSKIRVSLGLCLDVSRSLDAKSTESDDKDRYFPPFTTCMLEVLGLGEQRGYVFGLLDLRKEKMDGTLTLCRELEEVTGLVGTLDGSGFSTVTGSDCFRSTESSHVTRLTLFPSTWGCSFFGSLSGLVELPSLGLEESE